MKVIIGPDISVYEDNPETSKGIDFTKMRQAANFVIVRGGQNLTPDATFTNNWSRAKAAGLPRGAYWLYDSRADPKQQAGLWFALLNGDFGELPLFLDIEENYHGPFTGWKNWVDFLARLKELVGNKEIGIYTAFAYWRDNAPSPINQGPDLETFHQYILWIANYGIAQPAVPQPWGRNEWAFWQFTNSENAKTYGAESKSIDLNFFNGDGPAFTQRFNLPAPELPHDYPPPGVPLGNRYKVTATALNIRAGAGTSFTVIGVLKNNDIVEGIGVNADGSWIQIRRLDGLSGWCFSQYLMKLDDNPPPVPTGVKYRVTASSLNIRSGPDTSFAAIAVLKNNDIVDGLGINTDGSWTQIRRADGLTGWCATRYLIVLKT